MTYVLEVRKSNSDTKLALSRTLNTKYGRFTDSSEQVKTFESKKLAEKWKEMYDKDNSLRITTLEKFLTVEEPTTQE